MSRKKQHPSERKLTATWDDPFISAEAPQDRDRLGLFASHGEMSKD